MSAEVPIYVLVEKVVFDVVEVSAVTTKDGEREVMHMDNVKEILASSYSRDEMEDLLDR